MSGRGHPNLFLSKSLFLRGMQCHKSLYLHTYMPDARDEETGEREAALERGRQVGLLARELFPGGVEIPFEGLSYAQQTVRTLFEITEGTGTLYEAAFSHDGIFVKADILRKGEEGWELFEVKASTKAEDYHVFDVALQYHVIAAAGLPLSKACLVCVDTNYMRRGELDVGRLFRVVDLTEKVREARGAVPGEIQAMRTALSRDNMPERDIGRHCNYPFGCDFQGFCRRHIPDESVFLLGYQGVRPLQLYARGFIDLRDVPREILSENQRIILDAHLRRKRHVDAGGVRDFLDTLWFPLCFLDFETLWTPIPPFDGTWPYEQIPYQYSLHCIEDEEAEPAHFEFLAQPNRDPQEELLSRLIREISPNSCILAYNARFEAGVLDNLARAFPRYEEPIAAIMGNIRDLAAPFRQRVVYDRDMRGSWSQKSVLPALVPGLTYKGMAVADGGMAMDAYVRMCASRDPAEISRIREDLLAYCKLDTFGMVKLWQWLRQASR